jgi:hypothetical protein
MKTILTIPKKWNVDDDMMTALESEAGRREGNTKGTQREIIAR